MAPAQLTHLVIITDFSAVRGGAAQVAMLQARLMQKRGLRVTVFAGDSGQHIPAGMGSVALGESRLLEASRAKAMMRGIWNDTARRRLRDWIAAHDDPGTVYHLHGWQQILSSAVVAALRPVAGRVAIHAHDYFLACPNGAFFDYQAHVTCDLAPMSRACVACNCDKRSLAQKLWRVARQAVQNRAVARILPQATVVLLHAGMQRRLTNPAPQNVVILPNPVEPGAVVASDPAAQRGFLYVGDVHAYKGVYLVAEAARRAGVALRFAGTGTDLERLAAAYPEHGYTGWLDRDGLAREWAGARALVAPSLGPEPFGLASVEALAAGLPVVMSDSMLLCETLAGHSACAGFASGDTNALAALLRDLAADDARVRLMAAAAPGAAAWVSLAPDSWADRLVTLYASMLHNHAAPQSGALGHLPEGAAVKPHPKVRPGRGRPRGGRRYAMKG